jgi:hypothetical protein
MLSTIGKHLNAGVTTRCEMCYNRRLTAAASYLAANTLMLSAFGIYDLFR